MKKESSMSLRRRKETAVAAAVFLVPALLVIAVFVIYPILQSFITSGYEWNGYSSNKSFIGLANWAELLKDKVFWNAFKNNLLVMVLSIVIQMPIGLALVICFGTRWTPTQVSSRRSRNFSGAVL